MTVTKTIQIKSESQLGRALEYIINAKKTMNETLVSGHALNNVHNAEFEMLRTRCFAQKLKGHYSNGKDEVFAHHIIQSFDPKDNITPEQAHEIGEKMMLQFTEGKHEFVIATHVDQDHIHNHIIFNSTSNVDLKKFRWKKITASNLRKISDEVALEYGIQPLKKTLDSKYKAYEKYRKEMTFSNEIKQRLNFLISQSSSFEDFQRKLPLLNLQGDFYTKSGKLKKYATYKLLDFPQQRAKRDATLSKKGDYLLKNLEAQFKKNEVVLSEDELIEGYEKIKRDVFALPDVEIIIETWQVSQQDEDFIYLTFDYGIKNQGEVRIHKSQFLTQEDGNYKLQLKHSDFFLFVDSEHQSKSRYIKSSVLVEQLTTDNLRPPTKFYSARKEFIFALDSLNFLAQKNIHTGDQVEQYFSVLKNKLEESSEAIENVDRKIEAVVEQYKYKNPSLEVKKKLEGLYLQNEELKALHQEITKTIDQVEQISEYSLGHKERLQYVPKDKQEQKQSPKY
ncbi:relaxase/mobilization nuclease domain-containing protein [Lactococcus lactis]|uniref:relaxase/mobilization nuclease domain-containing protein n=1 Tax=Lactococcus lactis TaxID=1358 RepID=UPI001455F87F|nr:relaxase/mobilization nuclease domain-containing protein [Lactococcus lactis]NLS48206.1 relaxase/mobilization nuclease domain-containing protein [Lactococcus lactis]